MTALSAAAVELLAAVERGEVVRMPQGQPWNLAHGRFLTFAEAADMAELRVQGLVVVEPFTNPQVDRDYVITDAGAAALAAARTSPPTTAKEAPNA